MTQKEFRNLINPIIAHHRNIALADAKKQTFLQSNEVVDFLKKIGEPLKGHGKEVILGTHRMTKKDLRREFPTMSTPVFNKTLAKVVNQSRDFGNSNGEKCKPRTFRKQYIRPGEVLDFLKQIGELVDG